MSFFSVAIGKELLRFTAAHFIAFRGFREPLHGHTYQVQVTVSGPVGPDGYVVDFLVLKKIAEEECAQLHFRTLLPQQSDCLTITESAEEMTVHCEDGTRFLFPRQDVCLLPIVHTSSEEIARYLLARLRERLSETRGNSIQTIEVLIEDIPGQVAVCREEFAVE
ncbi:MAG: 6-pyruvoyl tetrahydropterin synthase [Deltaproteobacteria bacterium]|nr:MAG: 6-pyruvoyl tetrahydropterin synthase [Deltaproteobacteria bacterium]